LSNSLTQAIRDQRATLRRLGAEAEQLRRLPEAAVALMTGLGLFRILQPKRYGGLELSFTEALAVIEEVSAADGSCGWCLLKGSSSNQMAGYLDPAAAQAIWRRSDTVVAGNFNPTKGRAVRTAEGYRLSGRWDWGTGSTHSQWLIAGAMVFESNDATAPLMLDGGRGPVIKAFVVPRAAARLIDTWFSHGMRGTGSGDFELLDVVVPEHFAFDGLAAAPRIDSALYAVPYMAQAPLPHAALAIGIARGALEDLRELAGTKTPLMTQALLKDRETVQAAVGAAAAEIESARAHVHAVAARAWECTSHADAPPLAHTISLACTHATHRCVAAVDVLYGLAGGTAVFESSPIQRAFRDIHVAASHFLVNKDKYTAAGKQVLSALAARLG
jgi:indole-3-acetate monooxygenase